MYLGTLEVLVFGTLVLDVVSSPRNAREKLASPFLVLLKTLERPLERPLRMQLWIVDVSCSCRTVSGNVDIRAEHDNAQHVMSLALRIVILSLQ